MPKALSVTKRAVARSVLSSRHAGVNVLGPYRASIRHPLGRFCTPKRSKGARQMGTKSKLAKIVFHPHLSDIAI